MTHIILFDNEARDEMLPLTFTRPVCDLRVGILTIRQKWEKWMNAKVSCITQDYLSEKFPLEYGDENYLIDGSIMPSDQLVTLLGEMGSNEAYLKNDSLVVAKLSGKQFKKLLEDDDFGQIRGMDISETRFTKINHLWDLIQFNDQAIKEDFRLLTGGRRSMPLHPSNYCSNADQIFIETGAKVHASYLNTDNGPIYVGKNAEIMEGSCLRGSVALGEGAVLKLGAKVYGATSLGPKSVVGGEVKNVIFQANSNKGHDGYLGDSYVGEWCNFGAGSSCSNLKNNFSNVSIWNYRLQNFADTGMMKCGVIMGDYSMCAINTSFYTGSVVGVSANIFGAGIPPRHIPGFSWGGGEGLTTYRIEKAFETAERVAPTKGYSMSVQDRLILMRIFEDTAAHRLAAFGEDKG